MTILRILGIALALALAAFMHWSLPHRQIVRVIDTDVARETVSTNAETGAEITRDVRYINTMTPGDHVRVFRNTDTGWGWPPYFKFESADLTAEASNLASEIDDPRWAVLTSYGWRIPLFSMFPNTVAIREAEGPDERLIPWFNIIVSTLVVVGILLVRRRVLSMFGS
jgi:hypothetical protein